MSNLPNCIEQILGGDIYKRVNQNEVLEALKRLEVNASDVFIEFYSNYSGSFGSDKVPYELLNICENDTRNIESYTYICRKEYSFPTKFLVLSEMSTGAVLVLDTDTDRVFDVDFEGGDESLIKAELEESWSSFYEFLKAYFNCL